MNYDKQNSCNNNQEWNQNHRYIFPDGRGVSKELADIIIDAMLDFEKSESFLDLEILEVFSIPRARRRKLECFLDDVPEKFAQIPHADMVKLRKIMTETIEFMWPLPGEEETESEVESREKLIKLVEDEELSALDIEKEMYITHPYEMGAWDQGKADYCGELLEEWITQPPINAQENKKYWFDDDCPACHYMSSAEEGWISPTIEGTKQAIAKADGGGEVLIEDEERKEQIEEFVDEDHLFMTNYYDALEIGCAVAELKRVMRKLIELDPDYYDPYLFLAKLEDEDGNCKVAESLRREAFERAVKRISDRHGNWPEYIRWGWLENRHLMRALEQWAVVLWKKGETESALDIFRRLFRANPDDNQGIRHCILAVRLGSGVDWFLQFEVKDGPMAGQAIDALAAEKWFQKNAKKFPEEFEWQKDALKKLGYIN